MLDEMFELSPGTLTGSELTKEWDSLAIIGFIALADEQFNKKITMDEIQNAITIDSLINKCLD